MHIPPAEARPHTATTSKKPSPSSPVRSKPPSAAQNHRQGRRNHPHPRQRPALVPQRRRQPARLLCICSPAGQEDSSPNSESRPTRQPAPDPLPNPKAEFRKKAQNSPQNTKPNSSHTPDQSAAHSRLRFACLSVSSWPLLPKVVVPGGRRSAVSAIYKIEQDSR